MFCFVILRSPKPGCSMSCSWYLLKALNEKTRCFMSCSWYLLKALNEKTRKNLVWNCLELQCGSYWLLNHFVNENKIKSKLKTVLEFGGPSWCCWTADCASDWMEFYVTVFRVKKFGRYWFWMDFVVKQIARIGFGKKN